MPFRQEKDPRSKGIHILDALTQLLYNMLRMSGKIPPHRRVDLRKWSMDFQFLYSIYSPSEVKTVLHWLGRNLNREDIPTILSATSFRKHFQKLRELAQVQAPSVPKHLEKFVKQCLEERLSKSDDVKSFVVRSYLNYSEWMGRFEVVRKGATDDVLAAMEFLRESYILAPILYVEFWISKVITTTNHFIFWDHNLDRFVWRSDSKMFRREFWHHVSQWTADPNMSERILSLVEKVK